MQQGKRILIAVDDSDASRRAVTYVTQLMEGTRGVHVGLLHLELTPHMLEWGGSEDAAVEERVSNERAREYRAMEEKRRAEGRSLLERYRGILAREGTEVMVLDVQFKEPLDADTITGTILDAARKHECGTIVVGRHSFAGLKRFFKSHVGEELLDKAKGLAVWVVQ